MNIHQMLAISMIINLAITAGICGGLLTDSAEIAGILLIIALSAWAADAEWIE